MALVPFTFNNPWATPQGGFGDQLVTQLQAPYGKATTESGIFSYYRTGITIPVITAAVVSVFSLYNPTTSGKNLIVLNAILGVVLATTVVNTYSLYTGTTAEIAAGTFTTPGTAVNRYLNGAVGVGVPYSAYTHSGTPTVRGIIGSHGAVTNATSCQIDKRFDGLVVIPPGGLVSIVAGTAASTTSGMSAEIVWMELTA